MTGNSRAGHTDRGTVGQYSDETAPGELFRPSPPIHHGMVGHGMVGPPICGRKGVF